MTHTHRPMPVKATRDIRQKPFVIIPRGTPGEIVRMWGSKPVHYTVAFWLNGTGGATVTIEDLRGRDLVAA